MEKTHMIQKCLFDDLFDNVIVHLREKSGKEIPEWRSYELDFAEYVCPIQRYYITLREGPPEKPGKVVAHVAIDIFIDIEENATIFIKWRL